MGHSAAVWDYRAAIEIAKDWNGIDQVVLRSPHGPSAKVNRELVPDNWLCMLSSLIIIIIIINIIVLILF